MRARLAPLAPSELRAKRIDGVIFANTTGDLPLRDGEGIAKWVADGHAFMGMHSASDTFKSFAPYFEMLQGTFDGHGPQAPADLVAADTSHPANAGIGATWDSPREEMYLIRNHDRTKLRTLWILRHHPNEPATKGHFPVAWCRKAGTGRVFYPKRENRTTGGNRVNRDRGTWLNGVNHPPSAHESFDAFLPSSSSSVISVPSC